MPVRLPASLRGRLMLVLTALFAVLFGLLFLLQAGSQRHAREEAQTRALDLAQGYARHYERLVRDHLAMLDILLRLRGPGLRGEGCAEALRQVVVVTPSLSNLVLVDGEGRLACAAREIELSGAAADAARRVLAAGSPMLGMSGAEGAERPYLALGRPLAEGETRAGAILAFIDRDWLNAHFAAAVRAGVVLRIFDNDGVFVVRQPDPACCVGKSGRHLDGIGEVIASGRGQVRQSRWLDGVTRLQADLPLAAPLAGVVSIGIPEELVVTDAQRGAGRLAWLLAALALTLYAVVWFFSERAILRPLRALAEGARRVSAGETGFRIPPLPGPGEFAELGREFNDMAASLAARDRRIAEDVERLRLAGRVFSQATEAITITDAEANILEVNPRFSEITGYAREEVLGRNPRLLQSGRHDAAFYRAMWDTLRAEGRWGGEIWNRRKNGEIYPEWLSITALRDEAGRVTHYVAVFTDMTERKAIENTLSEKEARYRELVEMSSDWIWEQDAEFRYTRVEGAAFLASQVEHDVIGKRRWEIPGYAPVHESWDEFRIRLEQRKPFQDILLRQVTRSGAVHYLRISGKPVFDEAGEFAGYRGVATDVTAEVTSCEALRESRERLATLIEAVPDAVFFKDGEGRWQVVNSAARRLFALDGVAWQGRSDPELALVNPGFSGEHMACWDSDEDAWAAGQIVHFTEVIHRPEGGTAIYDVAKVPLYDEGGGRKALIVVARDVTESRRSAEELERRVAERTAELEAANRELEAFSYSVSHDLRAPLRAINGFSRLLEEETADILNENARGHLARVRAASLRMGELIDDLLELSRVARHDMRKDTVDLSALAREIADELAAAEPARRVAWSIAEGIAAFCDRNLIRAVLHNLLGNAWKYTSKKETARIAFGVEEADGERRFFVRDDGAGFDMRYAGKLFGAFQRLHAPSEYPGTGIGLATVARIVHRHGGRVWAEGRLNEGATFWFTLPPEKSVPAGRRGN